MGIHGEVPLVLVAADAKDIDGIAWHAVVQTYLTAVVRGAGAVPLILPAALDPDIDVAAVLDRVDGVLLPGSRSNVHPERYGEAASARAEPHDQQRDAVTLPLIRAAVRQRVPLLAICRGMQEMNVALGGSLFAAVHEEPGRMDHRAPAHPERDQRYAIRQDVTVVPRGKLAAIVGAGTMRVNSLHRQAIARVAGPLQVEAVAPDGTVEAVSIKGGATFGLGVQWHPEYWVETDPPSQKLFAAFGDAVRGRLAARKGLRAAAE